MIESDQTPVIRVAWQVFDVACEVTNSFCRSLVDHENLWASHFETSTA